MPTSVEHATAAPRSLRIGGQEWYFTPLSAKEWGEYFAWLRDEYLRLVKTHVVDLDPEDRARILDRAFDKAPTLDLDSPEFKATMNSPHGVFRLVGLHLRARHPDVSDEKVAELLNSDEMRERAMSKVAGTLPDDEAPRPKRTGTRASRRPRQKR